MEAHTTSLRLQHLQQMNHNSRGEQLSTSVPVKISCNSVSILNKVLLWCCVNTQAMCDG
jgi:hypothetical protein